MEKYTVKVTGNTPGHDGEACHKGDLYRGDEKIAHWEEDRNSGPVHIAWAKLEAREAFLTYIKAQPRHPVVWDSKGIHLTPTLFIGLAIQDHLSQ